MDVKPYLERYAMDRLSKREYSTFDLQRSLSKRLKLVIKTNKLDPAAFENLVNEILEKFTQRGLLSDERYKKAMVRYQSSRKLGFRTISQKLKQKGIALSKATYDELMENEGISDTKEHEYGQILELLERKYPTFASDPKVKARAFGFLARRGFSLDQIQKALRKT